MCGGWGGASLVAGPACYLSCMLPVFHAACCMLAGCFDECHPVSPGGGGGCLWDVAPMGYCLGPGVGGHTVVGRQWTCMYRSGIRVVRACWWPASVVHINPSILCQHCPHASTSTLFCTESRPLLASPVSHPPLRPPCATVRAAPARYEVMSVSRPAHPLAALASPLVAAQQARFGRDSAAAVAAGVAAAAHAGQSSSPSE